MPTPEELAAGAAYAFEHTKKDLFNVVVLVGFACAVAGICWLLMGGIEVIWPPHHHNVGCTTVTACQNWLNTHPLKGPVPNPQHLPTYTPLYGTTP